MSDFDARWRDLARAAQRHEHDLGADSSRERIDVAQAASIATRAHSRSAPRALEVSDLRGLALAASLFCACLLGLSWSANRFGFASSISAAAHDLTDLARCVPPTSFIPPPPRLDELEPLLADILDDWLAQKPPTAEISR